MSGVVGCDLQRTRTALALREHGRTGRPQPVGDGRRRWVPNACADGAWGSPAIRADGVTSPDLARGGDPLDPERFVESWRVDPWSADFLRGIADRMTGYLGRVAPVHRNGFRVVLVDAGPDDGQPLGLPQLRSRCSAAGVNDVDAVGPTDALVCTWLAEMAVTAVAAGGGVGSTPVAAGTVVAVAAGECWTAVRRYTVDPGDARSPIRPEAGPARVVGRGLGILAIEIARAVLARCGEGVRPSSLLQLLDAAVEVGGQLQTRREVEWRGALTDNLFSPLRLDARLLAELPGVAVAVDEIGRAVQAALDAATDAVLVVGGPGAVWPVLADGLPRVTEIWQSPAPEADLAAGAAWWPALGTLFGQAGPGRASAPALESGLRTPASLPDAATAGAVDVVVPDVPGVSVEPVESPAVVRHQELPPWQRYER